LRAWLQEQWHRITPWHLILIPLSMVFGLLATVRRVLFALGLKRAVQLPVPVIVVGNITAGGAGKTPLVLWLAEALKKRGLRPGIVSRGYGGRVTVPRPVRADSDPETAGDEPVLLARRSGCPVWVGRDRVAAAQALLAAHLDCNVIISDDGLQHYRLARDVEIAVVDGVRRFGNGLLLPAGPLREGTWRLAVVDAVVVNGGAAAAGRDKEYNMRLVGAEFYNLKRPDQRAQPADFQGKRLHAVAGIGHPQRFFDHLASLGLNAAVHPFRDHHRFRLRDLTYPDADAVLMTEKDAVKCAALIGADNCWVLAVQAEVDPALEEKILEKLKERD
jgi:tetraacyldisaccharide 4'-kinase